MADSRNGPRHKIVAENTSGMADQLVGHFRSVRPSPILATNMQNDPPPRYSCRPLWHS